MKKNVLILDDDTGQLAAVKALLEKNIADCSVFTATAVREAEKLLLLYDFDLFILDIMLPDGSGLDFAKSVRSIPKYAITWILVVSGHDSYAFEAIRQAHCYDYILKPFPPGELLRTVRRLLKINLAKSEGSNQYLRIEQKGLCYSINMNDILYIEVNNRTTEIHTDYQIYSVKHYPLSKMKDQLKAGNLCQCHRSFIVNPSKLHAVVEDKRQTYLVISGCAANIPVGVKYKDFFQKLPLQTQDTEPNGE